MFPTDLEAANVDVAGLRRFYKSDPTAPKILDILAARQNDSYITTVSSLSRASRKELRFVVRARTCGFAAQKAFNCGKFIKKEKSIVSRAAQASRFEWTVSLVSEFGKRAADKKIR